MRRQNRNNFLDIENQPSLKSTMKITVPSIPSSLPSVDELPHISPSEIQHIPNGHHGERHVLSPRTRPSFSPWRGKLTINLPVTRKGVERNGGHIPRSGINPRQKSGVLRPRRGIIDAHVDIIPAPAFSRERERERTIASPRDCRHLSVSHGDGKETAVILLRCQVSHLPRDSARFRSL